MLERANSQQLRGDRGLKFANQAEREAFFQQMSKIKNEMQEALIKEWCIS